MASTRAEGKVVQTELSEPEYRQFRRVAEEEGLSLKEALRQAALEYVDDRESIDEDDPFFTFHERVDVPVGERTDASEMDEDLYGDSGPR